MSGLFLVTLSLSERKQLLNQAPCCQRRRNEPTRCCFHYICVYKMEVTTIKIKKVWNESKESLSLINSGMLLTACIRSRIQHVKVVKWIR